MFIVIPLYLIAISLLVSTMYALLNPGCSWSWHAPATIIDMMSKLSKPAFCSKPQVVMKKLKVYRILCDWNVYYLTKIRSMGFIVVSHLLVPVLDLLHETHECIEAYIDFIEDVVFCHYKTGHSYKFVFIAGFLQFENVEVKLINFVKFLLCIFVQVQKFLDSDRCYLLLFSNMCLTTAYPSAFLIAFSLLVSRVLVNQHFQILHLTTFTAISLSFNVYLSIVKLIRLNHSNAVIKIFY